MPKLQKNIPISKNINRHFEADLNFKRVLGILFLDKIPVTIINCYLTFWKISHINHNREREKAYRKT